MLIGMYRSLSAGSDLEESLILFRSKIIIIVEQDLEARVGDLVLASEFHPANAIRRMVTIQWYASRTLSYYDRLLPGNLPPRRVPRCSASLLRR